VGRVGTSYLPPCSSRIRPSHTEPQHHPKLAKKDVSLIESYKLAWLGILELESAVKVKLIVG
jgi:hypothetical protein